jgi:hypothetical protein
MTVEPCREDRDDPRGQARVRVAALVVRIDLLQRVHPRDLHVREEGDRGDLVDSRAVLLGVVAPQAQPQLARGGREPEVAVFRGDLEDRRPEADRELRHAHAVRAGGEEMPALVHDHEQR